MGILAPIEQVELPIVVRTFHILEGETLKQKSQASHNIYIYILLDILPPFCEGERGRISYTSVPFIHPI